MVLNFDPRAEAKCLEVSSKIRSANINSEIYIGSESSLTDQLTYAIKKEVPVVIVIGSDEVKRGVIQIKNTRTKEQTEVEEEELIPTIKKILM